MGKRDLRRRRAKRQERLHNAPATRGMNVGRHIGAPMIVLDGALAETTPVRATISIVPDLDEADRGR